MDLEQQENYNELKIKYDLLVKENEDLKTHLKKYTSPERKKKYYQKHKDEIKQKVRDYQKNTNYKEAPEKRKEYNKRSYERRKQKLIEK
jgi:hypothetical protein